MLDSALVKNVSQSLVLAMGANPQESVWLNFVPFAMVLGILYFLILLPMKKQRKKVEAFQTGLKVGDKIITTGGIYGRITRVNDSSVQVEVADKVRIEIARASVGGYQGQAPIVQDSATT